MLSHEHLLQTLCVPTGKNFAPAMSVKRQLAMPAFRLRIDGDRSPFNPRGGFPSFGGRVVGNAAKAVAIVGVLLAASQNLSAQDKAQIERGMKVYRSEERRVGKSADPCG